MKKCYIAVIERDRRDNFDSVYLVSGCMNAVDLPTCRVDDDTKLQDALSVALEYKAGIRYSGEFTLAGAVTTVKETGEREQCDIYVCESEQCSWNVLHKFTHYKLTVDARWDAPYIVFREIGAEIRTLLKLYCQNAPTLTTIEFK